VSCWEWIAQHSTRALDPPDGLPEDEPPQVPAPFFEVLPCGGANGNYVISLDKSESMDTIDAGDSASRLHRAKQGAQIFVNLVDNLNLNHQYTVFGEVVRGMEVADLVAEGDVIVRATVVRP